MFGGVQQGPALWKVLVCRYFCVDIRDGIYSTRVRIIWADQTKNDADQEPMSHQPAFNDLSNQQQGATSLHSDNSFQPQSAFNPEYAAFDVKSIPNMMAWPSVESSAKGEHTKRGYSTSMSTSIASSRGSSLSDQNVFQWF